jgi:hypothetical protein
MAREVDLDTIRAEAEREPVVIRIAGERFEAPPELPFRAFRRLGGLAGMNPTDPASVLPVLDAVDEVMTMLIGEDGWKRHAATLSQDDVLALLHAVLVTYGLADRDVKPEAALGEAQASAPQ